MSKRKRFDWKAVRAKLRALSAKPQADRADAEAVFRQRARELAERREQAGAAPDTVAVLVFKLGEETYGLALADLAGVLPLTRWTPVPGAPAELLGVVNHRGRICSVLHLSRLLGLPPRGADGSETSAATQSYILLLRRPGGEVGLCVDGIGTIRPIAPADLVALGDLAPQATAHFAEHRTTDGVTLLRADLIRTHSILQEEASP